MRSTPIRVAFLGISPAERALYREIVEGIKAEPITAEFLGTSAEMFARLKAACADLLVVDVSGTAAANVESLATELEVMGVGKAPPVIYLGSDPDEKLIAHCTTRSVAYFVGKPLKNRILKATIVLAVRQRRDRHALEAMHLTVMRSLEQDRQDMMLAARILNNVSQTGAGSMPELKVHLEAMERANGDLVVARKTPAGTSQLLIGDFSGHGLAAAVGGMIASDIFSAMTAKGYGIEEIAGQINTKLHRNLPTGLFLAACLIDWDAHEGVMSMWNGGMPDVLIRKPSGSPPARARSAHPPLGILGPAEFCSGLQRIPILPGYRVYVCSDGLLETINAGGEMFGVDRLRQLIGTHSNADRIFEAALDAVRAHRGDAPLRDDVTFVELCHRLTPATLPQFLAGHTEVHEPGTVRVEPFAELTLRLDAPAIARSDPLPAIMQLLSDLDIGEKHRANVFVILKELVTNAIDHGLLDLDSSLKATPEGFTEYYDRREARLGALKDAHVRIAIKRQVDRGSMGDTLSIRVEDSGKGFDARAERERACHAGLRDSKRLSGRGIALVRSLCRSLDYNEAGTAAEVVYQLG